MVFPSSSGGSFSPGSVSDVQNSLIPALRSFILIKDQIARAKNWLDHEDLTQAPISMDPDYQAQLSAAIGDLNTALQAVDLSRVVKVTGLF